MQYRMGTTVRKNKEVYQERRETSGRYRFADSVLACDCLCTQNYQLTNAERSVAQMLVEGYTNREIAAKRGVSTDTVKSQVAHILAKTMTKNRRELMKLVLNENIRAMPLVQLKRIETTRDEDEIT